MSILTPKMEGELTQKALRIQNLDKSATKAVINHDIENLFKFLVEFMKLKKELKEVIIDIPTLTINNQQALEILRKVSSEYKFQCDKYLKKLCQTKGFDYDKAELFDSEEIDDIGSDIFYSWISHHGYIEGLLKINSLFLNISIPILLERYVDEARKCYALRQYFSVYALCRTILETAVRDIGQRKGYLPKDKGKVKRSELRNWSLMKNKVVPKILKTEVEKIYDRTSGLIHGRKAVEENNAYDMLKRTLEIIQKLYDYKFASAKGF